MAGKAKVGKTQQAARPGNARVSRWVVGKRSCVGRQLVVVGGAVSVGAVRLLLAGLLGAGGGGGACGCGVGGAKGGAAGRGGVPGGRGREGAACVPENPFKRVRVCVCVCVCALLEIRDTACMQARSIKRIKRANQGPELALTPWLAPALCALKNELCPCPKHTHTHLCPGARVSKMGSGLIRSRGDAKRCSEMGLPARHALLLFLLPGAPPAPRPLAAPCIPLA
eukprot:1161739-Pelagomonas_calceolata.AAC.1